MKSNNNVSSDDDKFLEVLGLKKEYDTHIETSRHLDTKTEFLVGSIITIVIASLFGLRFFGEPLYLIGLGGLFISVIIASTIIGSSILVFLHKRKILVFLHKRKKSDKDELDYNIEIDNIKIETLPLIMM